MTLDEGLLKNMKPLYNYKGHLKATSKYRSTIKQWKKKHFLVKQPFKKPALNN